MINPKDKVKIELVKVKPFGSCIDEKSKIPKPWKIFAETRNIKNKKDIIEIIVPVININLKGTNEKETKPSNAKEVAPKKEKLVFPANLASLSYSIPVCLNPTHDLNPRINKFFSFKLFIFFTTFFFIRQKSPAFLGTSISLNLKSGMLRWTLRYRHHNVPDLKRRNLKYNQERPSWSLA